MSHDRLEKASLIGGAAAAVVASLCCVAPLVLVSVGISGAWIANLVALEPYRPYALGVAIACVLLGYRSIYRAQPAGACEPGTLCAVPRTRRAYKALFWLISALVLVALAFPYAVRFLPME